VAAPPSGNVGDEATITGSTTNDPITISATSTTQDSDVVNYNSNRASLTVDGGAGNTTFNILGTLGGSSTTTLNTGDGNDVVNVQASGGATTLNLGAGTDTVNVGSQEPNAGGTLAGIQGALIVVGGSGSDTANVDDTGDTTVNQTGTLTATALTGLGMGAKGITYSGLAALNIALGSGGNTFNVQATAAPTATTVTAATGTNTFNIGSLAPATAGIVGGVQGPLIINGSGNDTANVDDTGDTTVNQMGTLTQSTLTGLGMGPKGITYSGLAVLNINLGSGGNRFFINVSSGKNLPATTTINGGPSNTNNNYLTGTWAGDFNGTLNLLAFGFSTIMVANNFNGTMSDTMPGNVQLITVGGSVTVTGSLLAGSIGTMTVGKGIAGTVNSQSYITSLTVGTSSHPGSVTATGLVSAFTDITTMLVYGNVSGIVQAGGTIHTRTVDGSVIPTPTAPLSGTITAGIIRAANINTLTVGGAMAGLVNASANLNTMSVGQDMSGLINVGATLGQLTVTGGTPGSIVATTIGTVGAYGGYGPLVAQIKENGTQRRVEAAVPSTPYPMPMPLYSYPTSATTNASPAKVNFQYFYEGLGSNNGTLANPQLTVRVTNASPVTDQYDLSLVVYNDTAKFNLARLDAAGVSGIRNVAVEGNILTMVSPAASAFFAPDSSPAGIYLPQDNLAGVGVRDYVPNHSINAKSIQAVAFGSHTGNNGLITTGAVANGTDAANLLAPSTAIV
jgi:hypothetical protein